MYQNIMADVSPVSVQLLKKLLFGRLFPIVLGQTLIPQKSRGLLQIQIGHQNSVSDGPKDHCPNENLKLYNLAYIN